jgi:hypothetical protein
MGLANFLWWSFKNTGFGVAPNLIKFSNEAFSKTYKVNIQFCQIGKQITF